MVLEERETRRHKGSNLTLMCRGKNSEVKKLEESYLQYTLETGLMCPL